jgi:hypothetical protein
MTYQVTVKDYARYDIAGAPIDQVLDSACREMAPNATPVPLPGAVPARRCSVTNDREAAEMRVYWSLPRLYIVASTCRPGACDASARERFHRTFRVRP